MAAQDEERALEAQRQAHTRVAAVDVQLSAPERNSQRTMRVTNQGPHRAENIHVGYGRSLDELSPPLTDCWDRLHTDLEPGHSVEAVAGLTLQSTKAFTVILEWTDGRGPQERTVTLTA